MTTEEQEIRRQSTFAYLSSNDVCSIPIKDFIEHLFKYEDCNGKEFYTTHQVKDYKDKDGKTQKAGSKSSLTLEDYQELSETGKVSTKNNWSPKVSDLDGEYYEIRPNLATKQMCIVDFDGWKQSGDISLEDLFQLDDLPEIFADACFFVSRTKSLPHFIFYIEDLPETIKLGQYIDVVKGFHADILFNHAWERKDTKLWNCREELTTISWNDLKLIVDPEKTNGNKLFGKPTVSNRKRPIESISEVTQSTPTEKQNQKIKEIMKYAVAIIEANPAFFDDYQSWSTLGFLIFNETNGSEDGCDCFIKITEMREQPEAVGKSKISAQFHQAQTTRGKQSKLHFASLKSWLKDVNPGSKLLQSDQLSVTICNNDLEAANHIFFLLKDCLVYSRNVLYFKTNHLWICDLKSIECELTNFIQNQKIYKTNSKKENVDFVQNFKSAKMVCQTLINKIVAISDNDWISDLASSSLGKILFTNGYYNFERGIFYAFNDKSYDCSIKFFERIAFDYTPLSEHEETQVIKIRNQLFYDPFGKEIGDYYSTLIARGLAGDRMKRCLFGIGSSNTGKSIMTAAIKSSLGGYYGAFNAVNIAYTKGGDEAQKLRWLLLLRTKRIIISNEIQMGIEIDGNSIKKIANGGNDDIIARGHGLNETSFEMVCLPIIFANDLDNITPVDDAVINRVKAIDYKRVCVDNPSNEFEMQKDSGLEVYIKTCEFKRVFVSLLIESYSNFVKNGRIEQVIPEIEKNSRGILGPAANLMETFENDFEFTDDIKDFVISSEFEKWLKTKKFKMSSNKFSIIIKQHCQLNKYNNVKSDQKKIDGKKFQVWFGIKEIPYNFPK